jgi:hypothetical protein
MSGRDKTCDAWLAALPSDVLDIGEGHLLEDVAARNLPVRHAVRCEFKPSLFPAFGHESVRVLHACTLSEPEGSSSTQHDWPRISMFAACQRVVQIGATRPV